MKVITVAMGVKGTIDKFRDQLSKMASKASDTADPLTFESKFQDIDKVADNLVKKVCDASVAE